MYTVVGTSPIVAGTRRDEATNTQHYNGGNEYEEEYCSEDNSNDACSSEAIIVHTCKTH